MQRLLKRLLALVAMVSVFDGAHIYAQSGTISGTVTDQAGAILPGAVITITNVDTNFERTFTCDEHGEYRVPLLPAGAYRIEASLAGFRTDVVENVGVSVDDRLRIDFTLQIGPVSERINIT